MTKQLKTFLANAALCAGLAAASSMTFAQTAHLNKLSAEWWQWALSIPTSQNPLLDNTGVNCAVGQHGAVWFLAGTFLGSAIPVSRTCTIPASKDIYFPINNSIIINTPGVCGEPKKTVSVRDAREKATGQLALQTGAMSAEVDGTNRDIQRVQSIPFSVSLPEDNIFDAPCLALGNVPGRTYAPAVDDGYYVLLQQLTPGEHTLHFRVLGYQDVTYNLTIVPD